MVDLPTNAILDWLTENQSGYAFYLNPMCTPYLIE